jgi:hypothetical protein
VMEDFGIVVVHVGSPIRRKHVCIEFVQPT